MDNIENIYKHFLSITHDRVTAALLTLAYQTNPPGEETTYTVTLDDLSDE